MPRFLILLSAALATIAHAAEPVTVYNFVRAETDRSIKYVYAFGQ